MVLGYGFEVFESYKKKATALDPWDLVKSSSMIKG
jgi:hypothetical protein